MVDLVVIGVERLRIDNGYSLEKEVTDLIYMNPLMILYLTINHFYLCHGCVYDPLTCGWMTMF